MCRIQDFSKCTIIVLSSIFFEISLKNYLFYSFLILMKNKFDEIFLILLGILQETSFLEH